MKGSDQSHKQFENLQYEKQTIIVYYPCFKGKLKSIKMKPKENKENA